MISTETARDIVFRLLFWGVLKEVFRFSRFNNAPLQKEDGLLRNTPRLLHVMGDNDHGIGLFELSDQLLYLKC